MVGTRSTLRREREQQMAMASTGEKPIEYPPPTSSIKTEGSRNRDLKPPSVSSSVKARRAQLLLDAAQQKAQLQMDIIDKKLAVDLAELESHSSLSQLRTEKNGSELNLRVEEWLETSHVGKTQCVTQGNNDDALCPAQQQQEALQHMGAAGPLPPTHIDLALAQQRIPLPAAEPRGGTDGDTMHMLASALKDLAASTSMIQHGSDVKLLNRLCTPKDLPKYDGDPLEWLQFKRAYEESSQVCNFTERENLWRLRKSLHGAAKEAVIALLIGNTSPDDVMATLELQFGNPDVIVSRILRDVSKLRPMSLEYHKDIVPFAIKVKNCVAAVTAISCEDYLKDANIIAEILSKLPTVLIARWMDYSYLLLDQRSKPKLVILSDFLSAEAEKATKCSVNLKHYSDRNKSRFQAQTLLVNNNDHSTSERSSDKCRFCSISSHTLPDCKRFGKALRKVRWAYVKRHGICFKCLISRHKKESCSANACDIDNCGQSHHRLLHFKLKKDNKSASLSQSENTKTDSEHSASIETITHIKMNSCKVLLKTVPISISGPNGTVRCVALLDDGSTVSLISNELASRAGLRGNKQSMRVCGAWDNMELVCDSEILNINVSNSQGQKFTVRARSVKNMNLPEQNLSAVNLSDYELKPEIKSVISDGQCKPEILIGQDNYDLLLPLEIIKGKPNEPYFTRTPLGWCMHGRVRTSFDTRATHQSTLCLNESDYLGSLESEYLLREMHDTVRQSFAIESVSVSCKPRQNIEDTRAWDHLQRTSILKNDRWYVSLPWKNTNCVLPDTLSHAMMRLKGVEKKMKANEGYAMRYKERIDHLLRNDYASPIENTASSSKTWYLPHFGVDNPNKQKLRLVFDAAAKTKGVCLNDWILKGPDLLISLYGIMLRFRENSIAVTADIRDMFLRIKILEEDRNALRFLWRQSPDEPVKTYAMSSLIFGANCSPFIAQFIKNKNAERYESSMPAAVHAIRKQHYMDDYIDSLEDEQTAINLANEITYIHKQGGFEIRNWTCNSQTVLNSLPEECRRSTPITFKDGQQYEGERTLGLIWLPTNDTLGFDVSFKRIPTPIIAGQKKPTKREMLQVIMSIFDIYGFLSPITIKGKIMLQDTWKSKISWDEYIPDDIFIKWTEWLKILENIKDIRLPRHYVNATKTPATKEPATSASKSAMNLSTKKSISRADTATARVSETHDISSASAPNSASGRRYANLELHVFCDASTKAMCATAYWRWFDCKQIQVAFISSKCRVAPVKYVSMPRLELQAALLGARLADTILKEHKIKSEKKYIWSDSSTVLHWIRNDRRTYKAYIAHRLGEIDEYTQMEEWRYIPTKLNIADIATRESCDLRTLQNEWLYGPSFLYGDESLWPMESEIQLPDVSDADLEYVNTLRATPVCLPAVPEPERFSSWLRLLRSTCVLLSFIEKCRKRTWDIDGAMMERAERLLLKYAQIQSFPEDLENLKHKQGLNKKSRLLTLSPFIDNDGILRVGGRIDAAPGISQDVKQPVILDGRHHVTHLIVGHYHKKAYHGYQEMVVNELKQKYWIIRIRPTVKYIASKCMLCRLKKAQPHPPRMGDLPEARMAIRQRPFTFTGVDLFGPMEVTVGRRREKRYGVIFTCLTVRAVHIEIVSNLTTDALIMALRRMAGRRGWPRYIFSDNGTNLRGADKELKRCILELDENQLSKEAMTYGMATSWTFIPPASPHWGGTWERLIRNIKKSLNVVLKEQAPREETLQTLMIEVEQTLNSRPLTHVTVEHNTQESLTPNHFLLGTSSTSPVLGTFDGTDTYLRKQWRISQKLADMFWKRWVREVLPDMRPRKKWPGEQRSLKVGDLVLIVDPNSPRNIWPRGIVQEVMPGKDGRVRVVDVKTKTGVLRRTAARIAHVPLGDECCASTGEGNVTDTYTSLM